MPVHTFESKPLVMSHYWYALESVRGHSRESSIHGITRERLIARALRYRSVPLVENGTELAAVFLTRTVCPVLSQQGPSLVAVPDIIPRQSKGKHSSSQPIQRKKLSCLERDSSPTFAYTSTCSVCCTCCTCPGSSVGRALA